MAAQIIYYRWAEDRLRYVVEELTEVPNGRLKHRTIFSKIDKETEAAHRVRTLRAICDGTTISSLADGLYPTDNPSLSHDGSQ